MANLEVVALILLIVCGLVYGLCRCGAGIVAKRGISVGADLAAMADQPRVWVGSRSKRRT